MIFCVKEMIKNIVFDSPVPLFVSRNGTKQIRLEYYTQTTVAFYLVFSFIRYWSIINKIIVGIA